MSVLGIKLFKSEEVQRSDFQLGKDYPRRPQPLISCLRVPAHKDRIGEQNLARPLVPPLNVELDLDVPWLDDEWSCQVLL